jgi:hypothetical protein
MSKIARWRVWCDTDEKWEEWYLSPDTEPTTCPTDTAHSIDAAKTYRAKEEITETGRLTPDGAVAMKIDPGTADTDPKFYPYNLTVADAEPVYLDLTDLTPGRRIQGVLFQVKGAKFGDKLDVLFASDGTFPNPAPPPENLPENTPLQSFGPINAPLNGGSPFIQREIMFNTSKPIPPGVKVRFCYDATDADPREVTIDCLAHQE